LAIAVVCTIFFVWNKNVKEREKARKEKPGGFELKKKKKKKGRRI